MITNNTMNTITSQAVTDAAEQVGAKLLERYKSAVKAQVKAKREMDAAYTAWIPAQNRLDYMTSYHEVACENSAISLAAFSKWVEAHATVEANEETAQKQTVAV